MDDVVLSHFLATWIINYKVLIFDSILCADTSKVDVSISCFYLVFAILWLSLVHVKRVFHTGTS